MGAIKFKLVVCPTCGVEEGYITEGDLIFCSSCEERSEEAPPVWIKRTFHSVLEDLSLCAKDNPAFNKEVHDIDCEAVEGLYYDLLKTYPTECKAVYDS